MTHTGWRVTGLHHVAIAHAGDDPVCEDALADLLGRPTHAEDGPGFHERMYEVGPSFVQTLGSTGSGVVQRFLDRRGPGLHHLAFEVDAIDPALADLARRGVPLIDRAGTRGRQGNAHRVRSPERVRRGVGGARRGSAAGGSAPVRGGRRLMADLRSGETPETPPLFTARPDRRKMTDWVWEELREAIDRTPAPAGGAPP